MFSWEKCNGDVLFVFTLLASGLTNRLIIFGLFFVCLCENNNRFSCFTRILMWSLQEKAMCFYWSLFYVWFDPFIVIIFNLYVTKDIRLYVTQRHACPAVKEPEKTLNIWTSYIVELMNAHSRSFICVVAGIATCYHSKDALKILLRLYVFVP